MLARKIIKCKIVELTNTKRDMINKEYNNIQELLNLNTAGLEFLDIYKLHKKKVYSSNISTTLWQNVKLKLNKNYPINITHGLIKIEKNNCKLSNYWIKIPVKMKRGGIWVAIKPHKEFNPKEIKIKDSKLIRKKDKHGNIVYWIYLTIQKEIKEIKSYSSILAIDLGEKVMATIVCGNKTTISKPHFFGKEIRGIRRHYSWLRKRLGNKKLFRKIKQIGNKEQRKVDLVLHNISKEIIKISLASNSIIFLGNLKGIRKSAKHKGKRFNRIVSNMPYLKLTRYIEYKAEENGIKVVRINERGTSHICSICGYEKGIRNTQGLFNCPECKYQVNADYNGAKNILKRSSEYISEDGAIAFSP